MFAAFPSTTRVRVEACSSVQVFLPLFITLMPLKKPARARRKFAVIDLFAGAGGSAVGAALAGADVRLSVELDPIACETLRQNTAAYHGAVLEQDISKLSGEALLKAAGIRQDDSLIIIGGPPCQPFSKAAYWTDPGHDARYRRARAVGAEAPKPKPITKPKADKRRNLIGDFARLVIESDAVGFMFENVPSILHPRNRRAFERFRSRLEVAGFATTLVEANSASFGVPQLRRRVVLLGARGAAPMAPLATHALPGEESDLPSAMSAGSALGALNGSAAVEPEEVVSGRWASELRQVPPGMNYKALTAWAGHPDPVFEAETRFWSFLLKLHPDRPSWTVAANPGPWVGPFHWDSRRLRTAELAALQSFPLGYTFAGKRRDRVRQIGNAMPPLLAAHMLDGLLTGLRRK